MLQLQRCGGGAEVVVVVAGGAWLVLALALCRFFKPLKCHAASAANASRCPFKSEMCVRVDDAELQVCMCVWQHHLQLLEQKCEPT